MNEISKLDSERIEQLAIEIRDFLLDHELWKEVEIYFNHKRFGCRDLKTGRYFYNDRKHLFTDKNIEPQDYFKYVNPDHILSMRFEGIICNMIYDGSLPNIKKQFDAIFKRYGVYYELGDIWNLTCYYIND